MARSEGRNLLELVAAGPVSMVAPLRRFEILAEDAQERGLTPKAWWVGLQRHEAVKGVLADDERAEFKGGRLVAFDGLPVKLLEESPQRLALWCAEGVLDL